MDVGWSYFNDNDLFTSNIFDDGVVDFSTNDGTDVLFSAGQYDGDHVGGRFFGVLLEILMETRS